jgi:hypothetical protein
MSPRKVGRFHIEGASVAYTEYDSLEEMQRALTEAAADALARATADQRAITWGDYFVAAYDGGELWVYGRIPTEAEIMDTEMKLGATRAEAGATLDRIRSGYDQGYRFTKAYSVVVPEGEWGDSHVAAMTRIPRALFYVAQGMGWPDGPTVYDAWNDMLGNHDP